VDERVEQDKHYEEALQVLVEVKRAMPVEVPLKVSLVLQQQVIFQLGLVQLRRIRQIARVHPLRT
jgi:hypothetical protein